VRMAGIVLVALALNACGTPPKSDQTQARSPVVSELPPPVGVMVPIMLDKSRTIAI